MRLSISVQKLSEEQNGRIKIYIASSLVCFAILIEILMSLLFFIKLHINKLTIVPILILFLLVFFGILAYYLYRIFKNA